MEPNNQNSEEVNRNIPQVVPVNIPEIAHQHVDRPFPGIAPQGTVFLHHQHVPHNYLTQNVDGTTFFFMTNSSANEINRHPMELRNHRGVPWIAPPLDHSPMFAAMDTVDRNAVIPPQSDLPPRVGHYHDLIFLESRFPRYFPARVLEYVATTYRATNEITGVKYCLRRIHGTTLRHRQSIAYLDAWKNLRHPNLVNVKDCFMTQAFGDISLIFVYDYYAGSETIFSKYLSPINQTVIYVYEPEVWSLVIQITAALRAIHSAGLSCRSLGLTKVIFTNPTSLKLSFCAVDDVLNYDRRVTEPTISQLQREDLTALGNLILELTCKVLYIDNVNAALRKFSSLYSNNLVTTIMYLMSDNQEKNINALLPMFGVRSMLYPSLVANELKDGRLDKLLLKLNIVINYLDRNAQNNTNIESRNRLVLKLFYDYIFLYRSTEGRYHTHIGHMVSCLQKLDVGSREIIQMITQDWRNSVVLSYAEIKECLQQTSNQLRA